MKKKTDWVLGIMGLFFMFGFLVFFIGYFHYISIGEWILVPIVTLASATYVIIKALEDT